MSPTVSSPGSPAPAVLLTARDREILERLGEHEPLSTSEHTLLFFASLSRARRRLRVLLQKGLLARVIPAGPHQGGRSEALWFLSPEGRRLLGLPARRAPGLSIPDLEHRRAVAEFFCGLVRRSLTRPDQGLYSWLGERACEQALDEAVRPDGFGRYLLAHGEITFYLELDRGTEPHTRLRDKLRAYGQALASDPNVTKANVLLLCPRPRRLRAAAAHALEGPPWIWASSDGAHFHLLGGEDTRTFDQLPAWPRSERDIAECLGRRWEARATPRATTKFPVTAVVTSRASAARDRVRRGWLSDNRRAD